MQILHDSYCYSGWDGAATVHSDIPFVKQDEWELVEQEVVEQKPADRVEQKFEIGDLITNGVLVGKIDEIYEYCGEFYYHACFGVYYADVSDAENWHKWTINDAKEGDVLVCKGNIKNSNGIKYERICLFNNLDNAFFTLTKTSNYVEEYDIDVNIDYQDNTVPATKEQKEILFKAMADAGYAFDFEKKELKEIDYKEEIKKCKDNPLYFFDKYVKVKLKEQNPTWSEEDEYYINQLIAFCEKCMVQDGNAKKCVNWLKSLRPQKRWKPSDEQMKELSVAKDSCFDLSYKTKDALKSLYNDLVNLKE